MRKVERIITETLWYDEAGNLIKEIRTEKCETTYERDALNKVEQSQQHQVESFPEVIAEPPKPKKVIKPIKREVIVEPEVNPEETVEVKEIPPQVPVVVSASNPEPKKESFLERFVGKLSLNKAEAKEIPPQVPVQVPAIIPLVEVPLNKVAKVYSPDDVECIQYQELNLVDMLA